MKFPFYQNAFFLRVRDEVSKVFRHLCGESGGKDAAALDPIGLTNSITHIAISWKKEKQIPFS